MDALNDGPGTSFDLKDFVGSVIGYGIVCVGYQMPIQYYTAVSAVWAVASLVIQHNSAACSTMVGACAYAYDMHICRDKVNILA